MWEGQEWSRPSPVIRTCTLYLFQNLETLAKATVDRQEEQARSGVKATPVPEAPAPPLIMLDMEEDRAPEEQPPVPPLVDLVAPHSRYPRSLSMGWWRPLPTLPWGLGYLARLLLPQLQFPQGVQGGPQGLHCTPRPIPPNVPGLALILPGTTGLLPLLL